MLFFTASAFVLEKAATFWLHRIGKEEKVVESQIPKNINVINDDFLSDFISLFCNTYFKYYIYTKHNI